MTIAEKHPEPPLRICLGRGAPEGMSDFLIRAGLEILPFNQKQHASLYVDFMGARPAGIPLLSIELAATSGRVSQPDADFTTDNWQCAASFILSHALKLQPPLLTIDNDIFAVIRSAMCVAPSPVPVIIAGEIGSGKQALARLIHRASRRNGGFAVVNCAALDAGGYGGEPGESVALDGAGATPLTLPANTAGGSLFLDEVGELSGGAQVRLMMLLQESEARPQPNGNIAPDIRPIAATNRPLAEMVERGDFRRDLYWRLNVFSIELPPLRRRAADIPMLARHFLRQANPRRSLGPFALKMLGNYPFPGNVRELQNLIARLAIAPLAGGNNLIDSPDIRRHLLIQASEAEFPSSGWKTSREVARREMVLRAIAACGGNRIDAARKLGITPRALQYHITKAGLSRRRGIKVTGPAPAETPAQG